MKHLRFFLSSPGDVADERTFAQQVIEQDLPKDPLLRGKITCEVISYDDRVAPVAMVATQSPQEAVDRNLPSPAQCDVVIVILWSRLGSTLTGDRYRKADGSLYESGTEWEFEQAVTANPLPHVLAYRRTSPPPIVAGTEGSAEKYQQLMKLDTFLSRFGKKDGVYQYGINNYESPQQFRDRLTTDLRAYIQQQLDQDRAADAPRPTHDPPYPALASALAAGEMIPFIGRGLLASRRVPVQVADTSAPTYLPSSLELSNLLADEAGLSRDGHQAHLTEVASYYEAKETRVMLRERLRRIFGSQAIARAAMPPLYTVLATLERPLLIITTNFDTLLERAFLAGGRHYDLVVYPADRKDLANAVLWWPHGEPAPRTPAPNELDVDLNTTTVIFKMHGTIQADTDRWDGAVITESDYVDFLSRVGGKSGIPSVLSAYLRDRSVLFLGFSLNDWASRTAVRRLKWRSADEDEEIPSWAVADHFAPIEMLLWAKRSVHAIEMDLDDFARGLGAHLKQP